MIRQFHSQALKTVAITKWISNSILAVVFGINSASNTGGKIVTVQGAAEHYYYFPACITRTINSKYYSQSYCYKLIQYHKTTK